MSEDLFAQPKKVKVEKIFCNEVTNGQRIFCSFLLSKKELGKTKTDKTYLKLELKDKTGSLEGRMWDNADTADKRVDTGMPVMVTGQISEFRGNLQIKVDDIYPAEDSEFDLPDLIRCVEDIEGLFEKVKACLRRNMKNEWMIKLTKSFLEDKDLIDSFKRAPGARSWHNAYVGGLMEHSFEVMTIVEKMCELYPEVYADVAVFGAFLHDVGKIFELDPQSFEYTHLGGLVGHIGLGFEILSEKIRAIDGFPKELALHLKHVILSHHGEYEQQSPVLPKTIEAIIVYHSDDLVSQANAVREIMTAQSYGDRDWSNFISIKNRKFFLKRMGEEENEDPSAVE